MTNPLPTGKLPPALLKSLLDKYALPAPGVIVGPGVGMDAAVLDAGIPNEYLIAKTDPITLTASDIGAWAITINANDVACMGGTPKWFSAALIMPEGSSTDEVEGIFRSIAEGCAATGIALVGGHTEITHGIDRPVIVGQMIGTVKKDRLITPKGARPGDAVMLTKGIAIEAVSIIARERGQELLKAYDAAFVERCRDFIRKPGISIVRDARIAMESGAVHALHDPTEGGLSSGLYEIAEAAGVGMEVYEDRIPALNEARELLGRYRLNPMGAIASGALIIVAASADADRITRALEEEGIPATVIGRVTEPGSGVKMFQNDRTTDLPRFERDEITKLF